MDKTIQELLDVLKITYFNRDIDFTVSDSKKLYITAKENGLSGTIYPTIKDKISDEIILSKFKKEFYLYVSEDTKKTEVKNMISKLFNLKKIEHIYLKGMRLKDLYPKTYMRSMGDIDFLVRESDFDKARESLIELGLRDDSKGPVHDVFFFGDMEIELHKRLRSKSKYPEFEVLDNVWNYAVRHKEYEFHVVNEFELIYLLFHLKKHLLYTGVGLRNIIDIGIYLNHFKDHIDFEQLYDFLDKTNCQVFFEQLVVFNEIYLGINLTKSFNLKSTLDNELFEVFTEYIIKSGTHGIGIGFNQFANRFAADANADIKRKQSIHRLVFPKYESLKIRYPKMMKSKLLIPIGWIRRWLYFIFKDRKKSAYKIKVLREVVDEEVKETSQLFKKMGL
jgi:ribosomal protein L23